MPYPPRARSWQLVVLLTAIYVLSFVDRYLLSLLVGPIKAAMALHDFQIGLLLGPAFAVFYATMGMPLGWAADRWPRIRMIVLGLSVWCIATAATGLAATFPQLFAARMLVGAGEAVLAPCAISLIADSFPPERRGPPTAVYMSGTLIGAGSALVAGGSLVGWIATRQRITLPVLGAVQGWEALFLLVGLAGLAFVPLLATIREPARIARPATDGSPVGSFGRFVAANRREYGWTLVGMAGVVVLGYAAFWNAAYFDRNFGWSTARIGAWQGAMVLLGGVPGAIAAGQVIRRLSGRVASAPITTARLGLVVMLPGYLVFGLATDPYLALAGLWFTQFGQGLSTVAGPSAVMDLAPGAVRARAAALYWLVISVAGLTVGPTVIGLLADAIGGKAALGRAIAILAAVTVSLSLLAFQAATRRLPRPGGATLPMS